MVECLFSERSVHEVMKTMELLTSLESSFATLPDTRRRIGGGWRCGSMGLVMSEGHSHQVMYAPRTSCGSVRCWVLLMPMSVETAQHSFSGERMLTLTPRVCVV